MKGTLRINFNINSDSMSSVYATLAGMIRDYDGSNGIQLSYEEDNWCELNDNITNETAEVN